MYSQGKWKVLEGTGTHQKLHFYLQNERVCSIAEYSPSQRLADQIGTDAHRNTVRTQCEHIQSSTCRGRVDTRQRPSSAATLTCPNDFKWQTARLAVWGIIFDIYISKRGWGVCLVRFLPRPQDLPFWCLFELVSAAQNTSRTLQNARKSMQEKPVVSMGLTASISLSNGTVT